jgi:hypothetical protein
VKSIGNQRKVGGTVGVTQHGSGGLAAENSSHPGIDGHSPVLVEAVMDLAFIPVHGLSRQATEEDSGIHVFGEGFHFRL